MIPAGTQWKLAFRNLQRNRRRNGLSVLMIAISTAALALMSAYGYRYGEHLRANAGFTNFYGQVSIYKKGGLDGLLQDPMKYLIDARDQEALMVILAARPEVDFVGRYLIGTGLISNGCDSVPFVALGVDPAVDDRIRNHPYPARWLCNVDAAPFSLAKEAAGREDAITVTPSMAKRLGKPRTADELGAEAKMADPVLACGSEEATRQIALDPMVQLIARDPEGGASVHDATIVRRQSTGRLYAEDVAMRASLPYLQKLLRVKSITYFGVFLKAGEDPEDFVAAFAKTPGVQDFEAFISVDPELNPLDAGIISWHAAVEGFMAALLGLVVAVIVVNFLSMSIVERRREIGILRALGFAPQSVMRIFQKEYFLLTAAGVAIGLVLSYVGVVVVNHADLVFYPPGAAGAVWFKLDLGAQRTLTRAAAVLVSSLVGAYALTWWVASRQTIHDTFSNPA